MNEFVLPYAVHTLEGLELFPAGSTLSAETLDEVILSKGAPIPAAVSLLDYGSIKADIMALLQETPYSVIFSDEARRGRVLDILGRARLILPTLECLKYFRANDFYTYRHILTVFALSSLLAGDLVMNDSVLVQEAAAGPSHDIGKICVPLDILKKTQPLTRTDRNVLEHHTVAGYVLLSYYLKNPHGLAPLVARDHHERMNGSGYPRGTRLEDPLVQIVAASDVYDALISPRPYRPTSYDNRTALEELTGMAERGEIGWEVVRVLVAHNRRNKPHYSDCEVSMEKRGTPPPDNLYGVIQEEKEEG